MSIDEINIVTERLALRSITLLDAESIFEYCASEQVCKFQTWKPQNFEDVKEFICENVSEAPSGNIIFNILSMY